MEQKVAFINEWRSGAWSFRALCAAFGISHTAGYKYIGRWQEEGWEGLQERSRAPLHVANKTAAHLEKALIKARRKHRRWGAEKLLVMLREERPQESWPADSTGSLILKRAGLVAPRRRLRRIEPVHPIFDPQGPNEVWSADFKGKFKLGNGAYCHPLTIADSFSRYVFAAKGMYHPDHEGSRPVFEAVFREYGLPEQIHTDNGGPFASAQGLARLSHLAVWFLELGIEPVYSDPAHPEQNGRHERMHRELKGEATRPAAYSLSGQQRKLNAFVREYNGVRPHQAIGNIPPGRLHVKSPRPYPSRIAEWDYPGQMRVHYVCRNGALRWGRGRWVGVSTTLAGKRIGLEELDNGLWRVFFRGKLLGYLDERTLRIEDELGRSKRNFV